MNFTKCHPFFFWAFNLHSNNIPWVYTHLCFPMHSLKQIVLSFWLCWSSPRAEHSSQPCPAWCTQCHSAPEGCPESRVALPPPRARPDFTVSWCHLPADPQHPPVHFITQFQGPGLPLGLFQQLLVFTLAAGRETQAEVPSWLSADNQPESLQPKGTPGRGRTGCAAHGESTTVPGEAGEGHSNIPRDCFCLPAWLWFSLTRSRYSQLNVTWDFMRHLENFSDLRFPVKGILSAGATGQAGGLEVIPCTNTRDTHEREEHCSAGSRWRRNAGEKRVKEKNPKKWEGLGVMSGHEFKLKTEAWCSKNAFIP